MFTGGGKDFSFDDLCKVIQHCNNHPGKYGYTEEEIRDAFKVRFLNLSLHLTVVKNLPMISLFTEKGVLVHQLFRGVPFQVFDREGGGYISAVELKHVVTSLGEKLTDEESNILFQETSVNADGMCSVDGTFNKKETTRPFQILLAHCDQGMSQTKLFCASVAS